MIQSAQFHGFWELSDIWDGVENHPFEIFELNEEVIYKEIELPDRLVLGKRVEHFFATGVDQSQQFDLLYQNIQVKEDKRTIGEFDFFIYDRFLKEVIHVELVCKFYLYDDRLGTKEVDHWIGPNRKDSLNLKLEKLRGHQMPLLYSEQAKNSLPFDSLSIKKIKQQLCFKASLFVPKSFINNSFVGINNACILGYWIDRKSFEDDEYKYNQYFIPQKFDWVINPIDHKEWYSYNEIQNQLNGLLSKQRAPLVWSRNKNKKVERFFIVWW